MNFEMSWSDYRRSENRHKTEKFVIFGVGLGIGLVVLTLLRGCESVGEPVAVKSMIARDCGECHSKQKALADHFRKRGNQTPEMMAEAVMKTKNPRLLTAIAIAGEKNTPYTVRKGGYKGRHAGAWQVNPKHWQNVPKDVIGQALQAERIITELSDDKPIRKALNNYGGDFSSGNYAKRVLAELTHVP